MRLMTYSPHLLIDKVAQTRLKRENTFLYIYIKKKDVPLTSEFNTKLVVLATLQTFSFLIRLRDHHIANLFASKTQKKEKKKRKVGKGGSEQ